MNFYDYNITSDYGTRTDPFTGKTKTHKGIDYALPLNTEVISNVTGYVEKTNYEKDGFGNYVVIKDGTGRLHYYAHLNKSTVSVGDFVSFGDTIGLSGSTGRSTGAHLHYEIRNSSGVSLDPNDYITTIQDVVSDKGEEAVKETISENPETMTGIFDIGGKIKSIVFNIFKFIVIAMLIVLFVILITKSMDISLI